MSEQEKKTRHCPICNEQHEMMMLHGMEFIPCPQMPENMIMPLSAIEAVFSGKSMLDQPFIVIT